MLQPRHLLKTAANKTILSLVDQVVVSGTRFATTVMIGRFGSDAELGVYSLAFSIVVLVLSFQESLISIPYTVFVKRLNATDQNDYSASTLAQAVCLNLFAAAMLLVSCAAMLLLNVSPGFPWLLTLLAVLLPFMLLREFARRFAFAHLDIRTVLALDIGVSVLQLAGLAGLMWAHQMSAMGAYLVTGLATGMGVICWFLAARSSFTWNRQRVRLDLAKNWKFGKWVAGANVISVFHMYLPHWMLAAVYDESATGVFSACMTVVVMANPFILGMTNVLSPKAAHCYADEGAAAVARKVWQFMGIMSAVLIAFCLVASVFGGRFIVMIFKESYAGNDQTIIALALGTIALGASYAVSSGLRAIDQPQTNLWAGMLGLAVTAVVSSLLVSPLGILGTTIGLVIGFYVMALYRIAAFQIFIRRLLSTAN
ncbi:MAG: lipopolysaccharide biosynthesis protein [Rubripirellula sp.]